MASLYDVSAEAQNDLFEIWQRIAGDSVDLANRIENEFYDLFAALGRMPPQGKISLNGRPVSAVLFPRGVSARCESDSHYGRGAWQTRREAPSEGAHTDLKKLGLRGSME